MIKLLSKPGIEGNSLILKLSLYLKITACPLRSGARQDCLLSPFVQYVAGSSSYCNSEGKGIKCTQTRKKEHCPSLKMIFFVENLKESTTQSLEPNHVFNKVTGYKMNV